MESKLELERWEIRSPSELINEVAGQVRLVADTVHAVVVRDPSRRQHVQAVETLPCHADLETWEEARPVLEELCRRWEPGPGTRHGDLAVVTVVVRRGLCVWTAMESTWSLAWRYALTPGISTGDIITVTEHGWSDVMTQHADHTPRLVEAGASHVVTPTGPPVARGQ